MDEMLHILFGFFCHLEMADEFAVLASKVMLNVVGVLLQNLLQIYHYLLLFHLVCRFLFNWFQVSEGHCFRQIGFCLPILTALILFLLMFHHALNELGHATE